MAGIILVGVDDTDTALQAAVRAAEIATGMNEELHVVSAYSSTDAGMPKLRHSQSTDEVAAAMRVHDDAVNALHNVAKRTAESVAETLREKFPNTVIVARAVEGAPGPAIIDESIALDASIVVVGNKRVQGVSRILGSVANVVARGIECDLLVVNTHRK